MPPKNSVKNIVWGEAAGRCCICKKQLLIKPQNRSPFSLGEIAHIVGENQGSARYTTALTLEQRNQEDNLLLLCSTHHTEVDHDENEYTVEKLKNIKSEHIKWVDSNLNRKTTWNVNISQYLYLNIPRLLELSELLGHNIDLSNFNPSESLHSLGWNLNKIMLQFKIQIPLLELKAISITKIAISNKIVGNLISFENMRFRTKNVTTPSIGIHDEVFTGNLEKDPHIYIKIDSWKYVFNINSQWITTTTAFALFRSGQVCLSGIGRITNINYDNLIIMCTPITIGIPKSLLDDLLK